MSREVHVRFWEGPGVRSPRATRLSIFARSDRAGRRVMESVRKFIERRLRLLVNDEKSSVSRPYDLTFLGFGLRMGYDGQTVVDISQRVVCRATGLSA